MAQSVSTILLRGGLNLTTPAIAIPPGMCIAALNYEPEVRGYRRRPGYERFDGQPKPSEADYWVFDFDAGDTEVTAGQTVTGATSGATGTALIDGVLSSGTYAGSDAVGYLVLYNVTGTFQDDENLQVSAATVCVADGAGNINGALTDANATTWSRATIEAVRSDIAAVPGSGAVRGVWAFGGAVWAIRDNAGATAGVLHKSTTAGWVAQDLGHKIDFTTGTAAYAEGETLTKGGVTSTIRRVVLVSGTWAGGDAAGYLTISGISGGSYTSGIATSASGSATLTGAEVAYALPVGGRYSFQNHNFYGAGTNPRMYATGGVGKAFEWDGTYFTEIRSGLSDALDLPTRIAEYSNHLFLLYSSGSVTHSGIGDPLSYTALSGAGEFTFGAEPTDVISSASTAMVIFGRNRVSYLTGNDATDFVMVQIAEDAGAIAWTAQIVGSPVYCDEAGIRRMTTTQAFGNWRMGTMSALVDPFIAGKRASGIAPVGALRNRAKDQYKLYYSDGTGLVLYMGRKDPEIMPFELPFTMSCCSVGSTSDAGEEIVLAGSSDGYVYQLDTGTSDDGAEIGAYVLLPFNSVGTPSQRKRFHKATLEVDAGPDTTLALTAEYGYGSSDQPQSLEQSFSITGGGALWGQGTWNVMYWDAPVQGLAEAYLEGVGRNCAIGILSDATYETPHTLSSITFNFTYRGLIR
jgi:hypothetical protein